MKILKKSLAIILVISVFAVVFTSLNITSAKTTINVDTRLKILDPATELFSLKDEGFSADEAAELKQIWVYIEAQNGNSNGSVALGGAWNGSNWSEFYFGMSTTQHPDSGLLRVDKTNYILPIDISKFRTAGLDEPEDMTPMADAYDSPISKFNFQISLYYGDFYVKDVVLYFGDDEIPEVSSWVEPEVSSKPVSSVVSSDPVSTSSIESSQEESKVEIVPGDVDGNGLVEIKDAVMVLRHLAGNPLLTGDALKAADYDGNESVEIKDAVLILRKLAE